MFYKILISAFLLLFCLLQYRLWAGDGGVMDVRKLQQEVAVREAHLKELRDRNEALSAEVLDLKQGLESLEERARSDLGMIRKDEVFYQVVEE
jgi:cell division protein FtsB